MPEAILFYGYNLNDPDEDRWTVKEDDGGGDFQPPWFESVGAGIDPDLRNSMNKAILEARGFDLEGVSWYDYDGLTARHCGVVILTYGHSNSLYYGIGLAGSVYVADDWSPKPVAPGSNLDSHEPLVEALKALGMTPEPGNPSWILAPSEF